MIEIYIPKKRSKELNNELVLGGISEFNLENINDLSKLIEIKDEILDFIAKLGKANSLMKAEYQDDPDIQQAIEENEELINKKKELIKSIDIKISELGGYCLQSDLRINNTISSPVLESNNKVSLVDIDNGFFL
ncbi:uncharacterized protein CMU_028610 [Cryptosporidium muris RN66]|uniref:Uncharacterized protein n=1 Tax=Cryptosporidium muris (strain RN66) TaxID=441375 RepID=B6AHU6_CRYMR|nr:uncharacterized protein CMU_028610 [Cryptosporidium muris RN66]EEA07787.1 hypothetical protein, conserved [Cryptosporidium muris RN66]|eukprot:XP_002142136.1 hypothetical protein [Cryptosporidium muris RN66]